MTASQMSHTYFPKPKKRKQYVAAVPEGIAMPYTENGTSIDSKPASASSANAPIKDSCSFISSSFMVQTLIKTTYPDALHRSMFVKTAVPIDSN